MPRLDMIVASSWIGLLAIVLIVQAARAWSRYLREARAARHAARFAAAVKSPRPILTVVKGAANVDGRRPVPKVRPTDQVPSTRSH
jgi:hypothetical protein